MTAFRFEYPTKESFAIPLLKDRHECRNRDEGYTVNHLKIINIIIEIKETPCVKNCFLRLRIKIIARNKVSRRVDVGVEISNVELLVLVVEVAVVLVFTVSVVDDE